MIYLILQISKKGYLCVLVYEGDKENIIGFLFVKFFIMVDFDDVIFIKDIYKVGFFLKLLIIELLFELLDKFQIG